MFEVMEPAGGKDGYLFACWCFDVRTRALPRGVRDERALGCFNRAADAIVEDRIERPSATSILADVARR